MIAEPLGLEKNLMRAAITETVDLVLDRGTIARADTFDLPRIHRRAVEVGRDHPVGFGRRMGDMTANLRRRDRPGEEREGGGLVISRLLFELVPGDGAAIESGWGA